MPGAREIYICSAKRERELNSTSSLELGGRARVEGGLGVVLDSQLDCLGDLGTRDAGGQGQGHVITRPRRPRR